MELSSSNVAVITGGASGIGLAMARELGAKGVKLVLADIEENVLDNTVSALQAGGLDVHGVVTDVSDKASIESLKKQAIAKYGKVNILCNNAGVVSEGRIVDQAHEDWEWVFGVNFWAVIYGTKAFLADMMSNGEPCHIVNTASMAGLANGSMMAPYFVTKHAVVSYSECLFAELQADAPHVGVSVLCPGFVQTQIMNARRNHPDQAYADREMTRQGVSEFNEAMTAGVESGITPDSVAAQVAAAIESNRFWILTHEGSTDMLRASAQTWWGEQNPQAVVAGRDDVLGEE
ncbi:MAG: SDR family NAD(P)-dependent oxidoreductase [Pseudomonadota bacterium]